MEVRRTRRTDERRDLDSVGEIAELVRRSSQDVAQDDLLGPMFEEVAQVDLAEHLPTLARSWSRALLGIEGYPGNPFRAHAEVRAQRPFSAAHVERRLDLFTATVDEGWCGPTADRARALAHDVARVHASHLLGGAVAGA